MITGRQITDFAIESIVSITGYTRKKVKQSFCGMPNVIIPIQTTIQEKVLLNHISDFAVFAGSSVSNTGFTKITGDCGISPDCSVGGFPPGILIGAYHLSDEKADLARLDLIAAYNDAAGRTCADMFALSGNIGGMKLTPGLYKCDASLEISNYDLIFDARGNANAIFIIQIATELTVTESCKVILTRGATASNIFWQIGDAATFGTLSSFKGTILAKQSLTFFTGAKLEGRALTIEGAVFTTGNRIVKK